MKIAELQLEAFDSGIWRPLETIDFDTQEVWFNDSGKHPELPGQATNPEIRIVEEK